MERLSFSGRLIEFDFVEAEGETAWFGAGAKGDGCDLGAVHIGEGTEGECELLPLGATGKRLDSRHEARLF